MSRKDEKWIMFRNFMHNELHISKEDIREWIQEAVQQESEKLVNNSFNDFNIREEVRRLIFNKITGSYGDSCDLTNAIAKDLSKQLEVRLKEVKR